ncbi:uncharacterized protein BP5553_09612 [Venustampulla echinocandica]|uniref:Nitroreductase domain-containing protein n=1 Tax=Venustampulla echinocandica TaxID=2656787 RepID=A0A370TBI2_9HELO|nr:uncharacterized protein BP5553_09612 [Venustampulla echinocandica]RDL31403.1 hypothetical protein BP5553_09612 [Venustampulla echinocandica]
MPALIIEESQIPAPLQTIPSKSQNKDNTLDHIVHSRHSTRKFLSTPIPKSILLAALELAQQSPSNSNIQPWRLTIATGAARDSLRTALLAAASVDQPNIPPLPQPFTHYRSELGKQVYGEGMGIPHSDVEGRRKAVLRNYEFFGAPTVVIVSMDKRLGSADSLSVGMFLQTFLLKLTEDGVGSCVEVSIVGYPEVVKRVLGIGEDMEVLCAVAVGFEDTTFKANGLRIGRERIDFTTTWVEE